jgi:hypothetical protein
MIMAATVYPRNASRELIRGEDDNGIDGKSTGN